MGLPNYSQAGQDVWVHKKTADIERQKTFLEIGACNGLDFSNTKMLEDSHGWTGALVEPHKGMFAQLRRNRPNCKLSNACIDHTAHTVDFWERNSWISGIVAEDTDQLKARYLEQRREAQKKGHIQPRETRTLVSVLRELGMPKLIDYFSLDVEGAEHRILTTAVLDEYRFNIIGVERPKGVLCDRLQGYGYRPVYEIPGLDVFYLHKRFPILDPEE